MGKASPGSVKETGAEAGAVLEGVQNHNLGLRIKVHRAQAAGNGGRIVGSFDILAAGTGTYAAYVERFEGQSFVNAAEFLAEVGRTSPDAVKCTHILNRNSLKRVQSS